MLHRARHCSMLSRSSLIAFVSGTEAPRLGEVSRLTAFETINRCRTKLADKNTHIVNRKINELIHFAFLL